MKNYNNNRIASNKLTVFIFLALLLMLFPKNSQFFYLHTDDHLVLANFVEDRQLASHGLNSASDKTFFQQLAGSFHFFNSSGGSDVALKEYGNLPWWANENIRWHMFRPIVGITHWADVNVFGLNLFAIQLHSLFWMLLLGWSAIRFYKQFFSDDIFILSVAVSLFVLNMSLVNNVYTLSSRNAYLVLIPVLWTLIFHNKWRDVGEEKFLLLSLCCLAISLFTAEAGIVAVAYLGAYALMLDNLGAVRGLLRLLPAFVVVVVWRFIYQAGEFGTVGIDTYLDPIRSTPEFLSNLMQNAPKIFLATIFSINIPQSLDVSMQRQFLYAACVVTVVCTVIVVPLAKKNKTLAFFVLGSMFAIVPTCAIAIIHQRTQPSITIGLFGAAAMLLVWLWRRYAFGWKKYLSRVFVSLAMVYHVLMPLGLHGAMSFAAPIDNFPPRHYPSISDAGPPDDSKPVIYLSFPSSLFAILQPYRWSLRGGSLPEHIFHLAPGINAYRLTRISENQLLLSSDTHFVLNGSTDTSFSEPLKVSAVMAMKDISRSSYQYFEGQKIVAGMMTVEVISLAPNGLPRTLRIGFDDSLDLDNVVWQSWNWRSQKLDTHSAPITGETIEVL